MESPVSLLMANSCRRPKGPLGFERLERRDRDDCASGLPWGARKQSTRHRGAQQRLSVALASLAILLLAAGCAPVAAASAGASHSCVVLENGSIKCWGENFHGQLGQPDNVVRGYNSSDMGDNLPTVPLGVFIASIVESGSEFNCALSGSGYVKCWGRNEHGQLGLGNNVTRGGPDDQIGLESLPVVNLGTNVAVEKISLAGSQACAVLKGGAVKVRARTCLKLVVCCCMCVLCNVCSSRFDSSNVSQQRTLEVVHA